MVNYMQALKRPFTNIGRLVIIFILYLIPIVNFIAFGFFLECAKNYKDKKMPELKNFGSLFIRGLLSLIIGLIYFLPALIIMIITGVAIGTALLSLTTVTGGLLTTLLSLIATSSGFLIAIILLLLAIYITPIALMSFIQKWKFKDAFKLGFVFKKAFTGKYFVVWVFAVIYNLILTGILTGILKFIPIIGVIIAGTIAGTIVGITTYTLYGQIFSEIK